jgi:hypothetical protein
VMTDNGRWRKSSFSGGGGNACVEVAGGLEAVRDSKNPGGPVLHAELTTLVRAIRADRLIRSAGGS